MDFKRTRQFMVLKNLAKAALRSPRWPDPIDDSATMPYVPPVVVEWPAHVPKPLVGLVKDVDVYPYWTKYRRFLEANRIPYRLYDIHRSDWLEQARDLDLVVWRPMGFPYELEECRRKFYVLERMLCKHTYPSFEEALVYEDKALQYAFLQLHGLPAVQTFVSHSQEEALRHMAGRPYPAVWKIAAGSGSWGVELAADSKEGARWARQAFSFSGRRTYWPFVRQKDYVYVQKLEPNTGSDLRVIVVGDRVFGYSRHVPSGDYRASGMGLVRWGPPTPEAVRIARRVAVVLDSPCLAVDFLSHPDDGRLSIVEFSTFVQVDMPEQLMIDGRSGWLEGEDLTFVQGRVWLQEMALEELFRRWWIAPTKAQPDPDSAAVSGRSV
jgi:glutathione synthase/RimK-type ligase-like ATP-grasp enzyme